MKRQWIVPLAAAGGVAALLVRRWQFRTGFEEGTGLPIPGNPAAVVLLILLALSCAALLLCSVRLAKDGNPRFPFRTEERALLVLPVAGAFLLALSGFADLFESVTGENLLYRLQGSPSWRYEAAYSGALRAGSVSMSAGIQCLSGVLTLLSAGVLLLCVTSCLRRDPRFRAPVVLVPTVAAILRLVSLYRMDSVNPVLEDYAPGLVALAFQVFGFYTFSAFAFRCGDLRQFAFAVGASVLLTLCTLTDRNEYLSTLLLQLGSTAATAGFLLLAFQAPPEPPDEAGSEAVTPSPESASGPTPA